MKEKEHSEQHQKSRYTVGITMVVIAGISWAISGNCGQYLFSRGIDPSWLTSWRMIIGGTALLLISLIKNPRGTFDIFKNKKDFLELAVYGILGTMFCQYSYMRTIQSSNAGTATVLQYLAPVLIILWVSFRSRMLPSAAQAVAVVSSFVGTFLVATGGQLGRLVISQETFFWGMISAVAMCLMTLLPQNLLKRYDAMVVGSFGMILGGGVLFLALGRHIPAPALDATMIGAIALMFIFGTVIAFTLHLKGIARIGSVRASMAATVEPVGATILSALLFGTVFTATDALGFALIILTVFLANRPGGVRG